MFTPRETHVNIDKFQYCRSKVVDLILPLVTGQRSVLPLGIPLTIPPGSIFFISSGCLSVEFKGRVILLLDEGDAVGPWICASSAIAIASKGAACELVECKESVLLNSLSGKEHLVALWCQYLAAVSATFLELYGEVAGEGEMPTPRIKSFKPGDVILKQGELDNDVYSLVEGSAEVVVDGVKVGTIGADEIFGMIAALTGSARSASVTANEPALAMVFNKNEFHSMLSSHPTLVIKMMEDMARVMRELNDQVVRKTTAIY